MTPEENFEFCISGRSKEFQYYCQCGANIGLKKRIVHKQRTCPCCGESITIQNIDFQTAQFVEYYERNRVPSWSEVGGYLLDMIFSKKKKKRS